VAWSQGNGQDAQIPLPFERRGNVLTDILIKKLIVSDKRREIPEGKISGLYFVVQPTGAQSWALRYRAAGRPKKLMPGTYPTISIAEAHKRA
jgi:Arm DNA-binding domain